MRSAAPAGMLPAVIALSLSLPGCFSEARSLNDYNLEIPAGWTAWEGTPPPVPGRILERYLVPTGGSSPGSLVLFRSAYRPETTVEQFLAERTNLLSGLPSLAINDARTIDVAGAPGVLLDITAEGTGKLLSPTGLGKPVPPGEEAQFPTRRLWVAIPRGPELGTLEVFFHFPESDYETLRPAWESLLASLRPRS